MKKTIPILVIFAVVVIFFQSFFLKGLLPIPSDTIIGLYHPFRDFYAKDYPNGIPYKNFLITDPVRQQIPWRSLVISLEKSGQLPLWNPYAFSGYPLLGDFQSAPLYPLNVLFFLLPFHISWSILVFLQPILGGIFLFMYLRSLKLRPEACILGSLALVFSGFFISWLEWNNILHVVIWLPLILLAQDKLITKWQWKWGVIFLLAEICSLFAGHLQIVFYCLCMSNLYLFARIIQKVTLKRMRVLSSLRTLAPFAFLGIVIALITAIAWIPTLQFILLSGRSLDQTPLNQPGWFIPWQHLVQFVIPDFFGNPTTLNYWGVWNYAELVGYVGIIPLIFALYAMFFRHDKKTYFFTMLAVVSLLFALPTVIAQAPFRLNIPLLSTSQPTRLLFVTDFALAILASLGFDYFLITKQKRIGFVLGLIGMLFCSVWVIVLTFGNMVMISVENLHTVKQNLVFPTLLFGASVVVILLILLFKKGKAIAWSLICIVLCISAIDLVRFGWKFTPFTPQKYLFPYTKTIQFLQSHSGNYRYMTTNDQIMPPNFSTYYRLQSIDGYDPLYILSYGEFIAAMQRGKPNITPPFGYNRIITPHNFESPLINIVGVKYVLSLDDVKATSLKKVFEEGRTKVYENVHVLPRAFFVSMIQPTSSKQEAINAMFASNFRAQDTAIVESPIKPRVYTKGTVANFIYKANQVSMDISNSGKGFLVLTDIFYPTWHVSIDGKEKNIVRTDYTFRGVEVPAGKHHIVFYDQLF